MTLRVLVAKIGLDGHDRGIKIRGCHDLLVQLGAERHERAVGLAPDL